MRIQSVLRMVLAAALFTGTAVADKGAPVKPPAPAPAAPATLPLPKDAGAPTDAPGGGGAIQVYTIARGRDVVVAEMRDAWKKAGWTLSKDDSSPSGRAIRIEVTKDSKVWKISFTGDAKQTAMIVTLPA